MRDERRGGKSTMHNMSISPNFYNLLSPVVLPTPNSNLISRLIISLP